MANQVVQKTFRAKVMAAGPEEELGVFKAIVSVFNNTDSYGDEIAPGAFTKSLAEWVVKGRNIPVVWAHDFRNLDSILGEYTAAEETADGLVLTGKLDMHHAPSARVHELMRRELIVEFSWSGEVREYTLLEDDEDSWWPAMRILDVDLWEAGPCFKGANPETELLSVKSDGQLHGMLAARSFAAKAGRVLSQKNLDTLITARDAITEVIAAQQAETKDDAGEGSQPEGGDLEAEKSVDPEVQRTPAATPQLRAMLALATMETN